MYKFFLAILFFVAAVNLNAETYVAGEIDNVTPAIKILKIKENLDSLEIEVKLSNEFIFCGECAAKLPDDYGQYPQVSGQGHVHVYMQRLTNKIADNRRSDRFCAFNIFNPTTVNVGKNKYRSECKKPDKPGWYQVCAVIETDSHTQRVKAHPQDFPPIDCKIVKVKKARYI